MYQLNESDGKRDGLINFYFEENESDFKCLSLPCSSGVLDLKPKNTLLASAQSRSELVIFDTTHFECVNSLDSLDIGESSVIQLQELARVEFPDEGLFLSTCWQTTSASTSGSIAITTQKGSIKVFDLTCCGLNELWSIYSSHKLLREPMPVWTVAWSHSDPNIFLTGGDDMHALMWDTRIGPQFIADLRFWDAGVTSAQWHPRDQIIAIGSYDCSLSLWDERTLSKPFMTVQLGGGVWRAKWLESFVDGPCDYLATANMQAGCSLIQLRSGCIIDQRNFFGYCCEPCGNCIYARNCEAEEKHLVYGIDFLDAKRVNNSQVIEKCMRLVSSSFYENTVEIWSETFSS
jgi:diphthamide biosynthesis protein 7